MLLHIYAGFEWFERQVYWTTKTGTGHIINNFLGSCSGKFQGGEGSRTIPVPFNQFPPSHFTCCTRIVLRIRSCAVLLALCILRITLFGSALVLTVLFSHYHHGD